MGFEICSLSLARCLERIPESRLVSPWLRRPGPSADPRDVNPPAHFPAVSPYLTFNYGIRKISTNSVYGGVLTRCKFKVRPLSPIYPSRSNSAIAIPEFRVGRVDSPVQPLHPWKCIFNTEDPGVDPSVWSHLRRRHRVCRRPRSTPNPPRH